MVKETVTKYVCPNGSTVSNQEECPKITNCNDECSSDSCSGFIYYSCLTKADGCKDKVENGKVKGKCGVDCLSQEDCKDIELCNGKNYKCEIKKESPSTKTTSSSSSLTASSSSSGSGILDSLKDLQESLEDTSRINKKTDECTKFCAGDQIDIPYVKSECHLACWQIYYYGGEGALDRQIEEYKNG